jgi:ABC-type Mn2+/Zn2+ transport system permease subunit
MLVCGRLFLLFFGCFSVSIWLRDIWFSSQAMHKSMLGGVACGYGRMWNPV